MNATTATPLSQRDRAVLRAVATGRCEISEMFGRNLVIDAPLGGPARLTASGRALLEAA
jgi:hypothetical protein